MVDKNTIIFASGLTASDSLVLSSLQPKILPNPAGLFSSIYRGPSHHIFHEISMGDPALEKWLGTESRQNMEESETIGSSSSMIRKPERWFEVVRVSLERNWQELVGLHLVDSEVGFGWR